MIGQKFGRLTVVELDNNTTGKNKRWICECEDEEKVLVLKIQKLN